MPPSASAPGPGPADRGAPTRRAVLVLGLVAGATLSAGCSASQREAMLEVDPRQVRLDRDVPRPPRPRPSDRERRRLAVLGGALASVRAYRDEADAVPPLRGRHGGAAAVTDAVAVHEAHAGLLGPAPTTPSARFGGLATSDGGPTLAPTARTAAVLGSAEAAALAAASAERTADDADVDLALLHARVAAARAAQATALRGAGPTAAAWPADPAPPDVVDALQGLLAQEHRAHWSYGVVLAWSDERAEDADHARQDHGDRVDTLTSLLGSLGAAPVGALATYPTDDAGARVDGPRTAAALALRLEDAVATATAVVLRAAVDAGSDAWLPAAVTALGEAERSRWSWGGPPLALPGD